MNLRGLVCLVAISVCFSFNCAVAGTPPLRPASDTLLHLSLEDSTAYVRIQTLLNDGEYAEAESQARKLLAKVEGEHGQESFEAAKVIDLLVKSLLNEGKSADETTKELVKRAIKIKEAQLGSSHADVAYSLFQMGRVYFNRGNYVEAESFFERTLGIREKAIGSNTTLVAKTLMALAVAVEYQGKYVLAESLYKKNLTMLEQTLDPDDLQVANSLQFLAGLYKLVGKYREAEKLYERALALIENVRSTNCMEVAGAMIGLWDVCREQGKYTKSKWWLERAQGVEEKALDFEQPDSTDNLRELSLIYYLQGEYNLSESIDRRLLATAEKTLGVDSPEVASILRSLAMSLDFQGKHKQAEAFFERALAIKEKVFGFHELDVASSLSELAMNLVFQDKYMQAESLYRRELAIRENAQVPDHLDVASSLSDFGWSYFYQERYAEAEPLFQRALAIREKILGPDHPDVARILHYLAWLYFDQGRYDWAKLFYERELTVRQRSFNANSFALSERDALDYACRVLDPFNNLLSCYKSLPDCGSSIISESNAILSTKNIVSDMLFYRRKLKLVKTDSVVLALAGRLDNTRFQLAKLYANGSSTGVARFRGQLDSLSKLVYVQEAELANRGAKVRQERNVENVSVDRIAKLLSDSTSLVEFLRYDYSELKSDTFIPHYLVLVLDGASEPSIVELGEAGPIDSLIDKYRSHFVHLSQSGRLPSSKDADAYNAISVALYRMVWEPLVDDLAGKRMVMIAPDGGLNMISFAGLLDSTGEYLIEKLAIHYLSAGRDLIRLQDVPARSKGLLAFGDPDYDASVESRLSQTLAYADTLLGSDRYMATHNLRSGCGELNELTVQALPGTRMEIEHVTQTWGKTSVEPIVEYFGSDASEENFKAEAHGKRVIHLATHGFYLEGACSSERPQTQLRDVNAEHVFVGEDPLLQSGLLLAGANLHGAGSDKRGAEDGVLTAYEVAGMNLEGTELVVLSACETGLGAVRDGEGVYGLRRAFQMSGARTVVSALWSVSDESTSEILGNLYRRSKESIPDRLRELQLQAIEKIRSRHEPDHPFSWAAFIALGDWR